jgi:hypothetical protein
MSELSNLPVELTDHELDQVAGGRHHGHGNGGGGQGSLVSVILSDLTHLNDVNIAIAIPISIAFAFSIGGNATATTVQFLSIAQQ